MVDPSADHLYHSTTLPRPPTSVSVVFPPVLDRILRWNQTGLLLLTPLAWLHYGFVGENRYWSAIVSMAVVCVAVALLAAVLDPGDVRFLVEFSIVTLSMLLWAYSSAYHSNGTATNFGEPLSRAGAFYLAVTTLTTTGYGDITPRTDSMRLLVSSQMLLDLLFLGVVLVLVANAIGTRRRTTAP